MHRHAEIIMISSIRPVAGTGNGLAWRVAASNKLKVRAKATRSHRIKIARRE